MLRFVLRFAILLLASYGALYFSHKYYVPDRTDFARYYPMYERPLDFSAAPAPFVYRQLSALATHAIYAAGIDYPNEIALSDPNVNRSIFFAALLVNYLGLVASAAIAGTITARKTGGFAFPVLAGLLCLMSFHSQSVVITGLTEGVTWLVVAGLYLLYTMTSRIIFVAVLVLTIFQRELIPVAFAIMAVTALIGRYGDARYNVFVLISSIACFAAYVIVRVYVSPAPAAGYENQLSPLHLIENLASLDLSPSRELVFQGLLSQNVVLIALVLGGAVLVRTGQFPRDLVPVVAAFGGLIAIGLAEGIGNNIGRIAGMLTPIFAAFAAINLWKLEAASRAKINQDRG